MRTIWLSAGAALLAVTAVVGGARAQDAPKDAAAVRKILDEKITLDFNSEDIQKVLDHVREKTKLNIVMDPYLVLAGGGFGGGGFGGGGFGPGGPVRYHVKSDNGKLRPALQKLVSQLQMALVCVVVGDTVYITTEDIGYQRQMTQRVDLDITNLPLSQALQDLVAAHGGNLVIDPRQADKAKAKVSLRADDVTLETALRLLTAVGDLSLVRVGNVMFVTTEAQAEKLRKEQMPTNPGPGVYTLPPFFGRGMPGFGGPALPPQPPAIGKEPPPPPAKR
jgi:hypothetical protein